MASRHRTAICREGWGFLSLLAFVFAWAVVLEVNLMLIVAGMLCGPALLGWYSAATTLRQIHVRRRVPRAVYAGESVPIEVEIQNSRKRAGSWAVVAQDHVCLENGQKRAKLLQPAVLFSSLPAGESRRQTYRVHLPQRGQYHLGPFDVSTRFPFGLFRRTMTLETSDTLTVFPRLGRLTSNWSMHHHEVVEGTHGGQRSTRAPGEFFDVREWQSGDSVRWIHWRSSARHGELVVRQFEQTRHRDVTVLLDLWQPSEPGTKDLENVELAVSFAATVVVDLCRRRNSNLTVSIAGAELASVSGATSDLLMNEILKKLAVTQATSEDDVPTEFEAVLDEVRAGAVITVISTRTGDLGRFQRFAAQRALGCRQPATWRTHTISIADPKFSEYFQAE